MAFLPDLRKFHDEAQRLLKKDAEDKNDEDASTAAAVYGTVGRQETRAHSHAVLLLPATSAQCRTKCGHQDYKSSDY